MRRTAGMDHYTNAPDFCETDSGRVRGATQFLQLEQHREHALQLPVEVSLVAGKSLEPVGIDGFAKCLGANHPASFCHSED